MRNQCRPSTSWNQPTEDRVGPTLRPSHRSTQQNKRNYVHFDICNIWVHVWNSSAAIWKRWKVNISTNSCNRSQIKSESGCHAVWLATGEKWMEAKILYSSVWNQGPTLLTVRPPPFFHSERLSGVAAVRRTRLNEWSVVQVCCFFFSQNSSPPSQRLASV